MIRAVLFLVVSLLLPMQAIAQQYPALYDVVGVADNDVLNIRKQPSASSEIVGSFVPSMSQIEVVAQDPSGKWGRVNVGEGSGWTSLRYLSKAENDADYLLTRRLSCFGTEPFWSLSIVQGHTARLSGLDSKEQKLSAGLIQPALGRTSPLLLGLGENHAAIIRHQACNDGMSDRAFGLTIDLLTPDNGLTLMTGCCSISQ